MIAYAMVKINNMTEFAKSQAYIVARYWDGGYWYYGAYNDAVKAYAVADEVGGVVFENAGTGK